MEVSMREKKKSFAWVALFLALVMIFTACGSSAPKEEGTSGQSSPASSSQKQASQSQQGQAETKKEDANGKVSLVFWHGMGGEPGKALKKLVDQYNSSQDKVFVQESYQGSYDDTLTKLRATASGASVGADLVQIYDLGTAFMIKSGLIKSMQDYIDKDKYDISKLEENCLAYYNLDGKLNSMPFNSSTPILYYNADLLKKAGIDKVPTNMKEIFALKDKLKVAGAETPIAFDIYGWYMEQWFSKMEKPLYDQGNGRQGTPTKALFDENGGMDKILTMWKTAIDDKIIVNTGREGAQSAAEAAFVSGKTAMTLASTASLSTILKEVGDRFTVGTAYYPGIDEQDKGGVSIGGASLWMIDSGDQAKMDACWDFIKFLMKPESQAQWNAETGYFPVNKDAHNTDIFKNNIKTFPQFETAINQLHDSTPANQGALSGVNQESRQIMEGEVESLLNNKQDKAAAIKNMADKINKALTDYNAANKGK